MATKYEYYSSKAGNAGVYGVRKYGQTFTPQTAHSLTSVFLQLYAYGGGNSGTITLSLYETSGSLPTGLALDTATIDASTVGADASHEFVFSGGEELSDGVEYCFAIANPSGTSGSHVNWYMNNSGAYGNGQGFHDTGGGWTADAARDFYFAEWGDEIAAVPEKATTPFPAHEANKVAGGIAETLTWVDGGAGEANAATSYDVYFGNSFDGPVTKVADGITETSWVVPANINDLLGNLGGDYLNEATTYEWKVVSINDEGETEGDTWDFGTSLIRGLGKARDPVPATAATGQSINLSQVAWGDGEGASSYKVYFGPTGSLALIGTVDYAAQAQSLAYQSMIIGTEYSWRVDSVNSLGTVTGDVWAFTTASDFSPPTVGEIVTIRKLVGTAKDSFYYEDV